MIKSYKAKKDIKVYWAPVWDDPQYWSLLYKDPELVTKDLAKDKVKDLNPLNFLRCPAHIEYFKNTYMIRTVLPTEINVVNGEAIISDGGNLGGKIGHEPTLKDRHLLHMFMGWIFFTEEESLLVSSMPPFFHQTEHSKYASLVPGSFDVGKWFRPVNAEYQLWQDIDKFVMLEDEPMMYVKFHTDQNVILERFHLNSTLDDIRKHVQDSSFWQPRRTMAQRYEQFKNSRLKSLILKEIKENLY